ncbi:U3 snoRNP protein [Tieghemostelium lacteum]|uniref:U3 snoRNP protein n=1 Tax=Tieghemostelium lacteum TaxID=361077 RepID=A0A151ZJ42_TIELA|nr:U3 snoRNP protein [Tieghemostelium lacteum]|eukprot:KYQ94018.1 U3 snoRNP protein [Tieghemostelium lacteum]
MAKLNKSDKFQNSKEKIKKTVTSNNGNKPTVKVINPFDRKINRIKHEVLGKKVKGQEGNIGQSRFNAIEKRKNTLLVEMKHSKKDNKFVDSRIGENDSSMTEDDKLLQRFQREKIRNKNLYNLDDDNDEQLTHLGQSIGDRLLPSERITEDYEKDSDDEYNDEESEFLNESNRFGGGAGAGGDGSSTVDKNKSTKEIYREIIEKSKQGKAEKARDKLAKEDLTRELDEEFDEIRGELFLRSDKREDQMDQEDEFLKFQQEQKRMQKDQQEKEQLEKKTTQQQKSQDKYADFDSLLVELSEETKARATDRLKTQDEIFKAEKEKLEKLEADRLKRMRGDDSDEEMSDHDTKRKNDNRPRMSGVKSADSLDDDFGLSSNPEGVTEYIPNLDSDNDQNDQDDENESDNEEDEENHSEDNEDDDDDEDEDEDEEDDDLESDIETNENQDEEEVEDNNEDNKKEKVKKVVEAIPFTFEVPNSIEELEEWMESRILSDRVLILERIRICNHISIKPQNKEKMKGYIQILYQRFLNVAKVQPINMEELNIMTKHIIEVSQDVPTQSSESAKVILDKIYKRLSKKIELNSKVNYWPHQEEMIFFVLLPRIFPNTDFQHTVLTPTVDCINLLLSHCPIRNYNDIKSSLFLSNTLFGYLSTSNRYSPEITSLYISLLSQWIQHQSTTTTTTTTNINNNNNNSKKSTNNNNWASISNSHIFIPTLLLTNEYLKLNNTKPDQLKTVNIGKLKLQQQLESTTDQLKLEILEFILQFLIKYLKVYQQSQYKESIIFIATIVLEQIESINKLKLTFPAVISKSLKDCKQQCTDMIKEIQQGRVPLTLLLKKPQSLKQFNPRFNQVFSLYNKDPDQQKAYEKKMKKLIKQEKKGAIREIVKDNYFIQSEKFKQAQEERKENTKKRNQIVAELQKEQHESNQYKKLKDRLDGRI